MSPTPTSHPSSPSPRLRGGARARRAGPWLAALAVLVAGLGAGALGTAGPASAVEPLRTHFTGEGTQSAEWADPGNWSSGVPGPDSIAVVDRLPSGDCAAVQGDVAQVAALELTQCGTVTLAGLTAGSAVVADEAHLATPTTVTGSFTWSGGSLTHQVVIPTGAVMTAEATGTKVLHDLEIDGSLVLAGGAVEVQDYGLASSGTITLEDDTILTGTGPVAQDGTLDVGEHVLTLDGPAYVAHGGARLAGGRLVLADGVHTLHDGVGFSGSGEVVLEGEVWAGEHVSLDEEVTMRLAGATLDGLLRLGGSGTLEWTAGEVLGRLLIGDDATLEVSGETEKRAAYGFVNDGTVRLSGGALTIAEAVANRGQLVVETAYVVRGSGLFDNETWGTVVLAAPLTLDGPRLFSSGRVELRSSRLSLGAGTHRLHANSWLVTRVDGGTGTAGRIEALGRIRLDGTLRLAEVQGMVERGRRVEVVEARARTGRFDEVRGSSGRPWVASYTPSAVRVRVR